jgi:hypothetical protein
MRPPLTLDALIEGQFCRIGQWQLDDTASLVLNGSAPNEPGVYAFVIDGIAHYVGVASTSLAKRLYFYCRPGGSQKTNIRLNAAICEAVTLGTTIDIYIATPPALQWSGWIISGPEGLEAGMIKTFALPWNQRGGSTNTAEPIPSFSE